MLCCVVLPFVVFVVFLCCVGVSSRCDVLCCVVVMYCYGEV